MTRRLAALLLVPAALAGWGLVALGGWLLWTHPVMAFLVLLAVVLTVVVHEGQRRTPAEGRSLPPRGVARRAPSHLTKG